MIDPVTLDRVTELAQTNALDETMVQSMRSNWPGVHFSYCLDDDVCGVEPVRSVPGVNIYLVDGRGHCLTLTNDPQAATGLILAEVEAE